MMNVCELLYKVRVLNSAIRGRVFTSLYSCKGSLHRVGRNVNIRGTFECGKKCQISDNVNIYSNVTLGDNVCIGDNVELRCNSGRKIVIGDDCSVNRNCVIGGNVKVGNSCRIGSNCNIYGSNHVFKSVDKPIRKQGMSSKGISIEDDCWLGANVLVVDGVTIGKGSVVGGGAVVISSIPPYSIAVGNPCRVVKKRVQ